jgi:hypothetical protein
LTPDLTVDDKAIIVALLRETIERDRFPLPPHVKPLKVILTGDLRNVYIAMRRLEKML